MSVGLDAERLEALRHPAAHPHDPDPGGGVEWIQTHLSHVFLTRERVYKLRKPVDLGFVDFTSLAERNADCLREVRLNRRLAPDVYLGVAPLREAGEGLEIGALVDEGEALTAREHCVVMRRLPDGRDALSLLQEGRLQPEQLDRLADRVARFHERHRLGRPAPFEPDEWRERCVAPARVNLEMLGSAPPGLLDAERLVRVRRSTEAFVGTHGDRFERRRRDGRAVDAHGDLHLQHVWIESDDAEPIAIDCLEFDEGLRHIDAASEVAFTAMDLAYRGARALGERFLRRYARVTDDYDLYRVVDFFAAYRACVRAKVAAIAFEDEEIDPAQRERAGESASAHLALADALLAPPAAGAWLLVGGPVGSGKTTAAEFLAERLEAVVVSSDRVRKRRAGLEPGDPGGPELYTDAARRRVYAEMLQRAEAVAASGRTAILDATWSEAGQRRTARERAAGLGVRCAFLETRCRPDLARERLARRSAARNDASDAGPGLLERSIAEFDAPDAERDPPHARVDTDREGWREGLAERVARLLR